MKKISAKRRSLTKKLKRESKLVKIESMRILAEFEKIPYLNQG